MLFDLLWLNGKDLRQLPLTERKKRLRQLTENSDCERVIYTRHIEMRGCVLYRAIEVFVFQLKSLSGWQSGKRFTSIFSLRRDKSEPMPLCEMYDPNAWA